MKEIKRYRFIKTTWDTFYRVTIGYIKEHKLGGYTEYSNYKKVLDENKQLQARIKELESQTHINEIKAQGIEDMLNDDVFKEYVRYSLRGLDSTEMDDYTYLENVRNYAEQLRTNMTNHKLTDEEYQSLCRFVETVEDDGTYDIEKPMIKALSSKKAIIHIGFGVSNYRLWA